MLSSSVFIIIIVFINAKRCLASNNVSRVHSEQNIIVGLDIANTSQSSSEKIEINFYVKEDFLNPPSVYWGLKVVTVISKYSEANTG